DSVPPRLATTAAIPARSTPGRAVTMSWLRISCLVDGVGAGGFFCGGVFRGGVPRGGLGVVGVGFVVAGGRRGGGGRRGRVGMLAICRPRLVPFAIRGAL